jgi:acyl-CoA carboxylase subunit alpha
MITRVLVANRGEIARRVFRTCRDAGIGTVAVFSDPDEHAPHTGEADTAVRLPGERPADTYLDGDAIVAASLAAGADAIHPGYGFLSENAAFATAAAAAGLTWIGPPAAAIAAMGSKIEAKKLMSDAGVPVLPELNPADVTAGDLPILVKPSAGGGGRGMRVVRTVGELAATVESARREAMSAFGESPRPADPDRPPEPAVFCEPLLEDSRHIEVQILADAHGTVWTLGERECSIQRRHQKIIEEAPSPTVTPELRAELCAAATAAARAIGYAGAGTVEFMLAPDGRFFFLEVNTRLQVEHPVTECRYGIDLVALQIQVAEGVALPPEPPQARGHAIEARLYAEDPAADWRPGSGTLHTFDLPDVDSAFTGPAGYGLRLDSGVVGGSTVGVHYDPMLAKVIAWAPSRAAAARRLATALAGARVHGVTTNRDLLVNVLRHPAFLAGDTDTGFLDRHGVAALATPRADGSVVRLSALAAALAGGAANRAGARVLAALPSGWRNVPAQPQLTAFEGPDGEIDVAYRLTRAGLTAEGFDGVALVRAEPDRVVLDVGATRRVFGIVTVGEDVYVDSALGSVALRRLPRFPDPSAHVAPGSLLAPMPGTVVRVEVAVGESVEPGRPVLTLEAMKMEHQIAAPAAGLVAELRVASGQQVDAGSVLAVITEREA